MGINKKFIAKNGLDNNNQTITNVADPVNAQDVATKNFTSNASNLTSGTIPDTRISTSYVKANLDGNVGIGTASPTTKLQVDGILTLNGGGIEGGELRLNNVNNTATASFIDVDSGNALRVYNSLPTSTILYTNSAERMRITSAGNVGIGTNNPQDALHVKGGVNSMVISEGGNGYGSFMTKSSGTLGSYIFFSNATNGERNRLSSNDDGTLLFGAGTSGIEQMRIGPTADVNIGLGAPTVAAVGRRLTINNLETTSAWSNAGITLTTKNFAGTGNSFLDILKNKNGDVYFHNSESKESANFQFAINGSTKAVLNSSSNGNTYLRVQTATASNATINLVNSLKTYDIANNSSGALDFYDQTAGASRLFIDTNGNVGIGEQNPTGWGSKLAVSKASGTNQIAILNSGTTGSDVSVITAYAGGRSTTISQYGNGYGYVTSNSPNGICFGTASVGEVVFQQAGATRAIIANDANLYVINGSSFGYGGGSGGTVTQATSKSTAVTLNKPNGLITMTADALSSGAVSGFNFYNSTITPYSHIVVSVTGAGINTMSYNVWATAASDGLAYVCIKNISAGSLSEAVQIRFAVIRGSIA